MYGHRKSDRPIVTVEAVEQRWVRFLPAETVEERGLAEGNPFRQNKFWAQYQGRNGCEGFLC